MCVSGVFTFGIQVVHKLLKLDCHNKITVWCKITEQFGVHNTMKDNSTVTTYLY